MDRKRFDGQKEKHVALFLHYYLICFQHVVEFLKMCWFSIKIMEYNDIP